MTKNITGIDKKKEHARLSMKILRAKNNGESPEVINQLLAEREALKFAVGGYTKQKLYNTTTYITQNKVYNKDNTTKAEAKIYNRVYNNKEEKPIPKLISLIKNLNDISATRHSELVNWFKELKEPFDIINEKLDYLTEILEEKIIFFGNEPSREILPIKKTTKVITKTRSSPESQNQLSAEGRALLSAGIEKLELQTGIRKVDDYKLWKKIVYKKVYNSLPEIREREIQRKKLNKKSKKNQIIIPPLPSS